MKFPKLIIFLCVFHSFSCKEINENHEDNSFLAEIIIKENNSYFSGKIGSYNDLKDDDLYHLIESQRVGVFDDSNVKIKVDKNVSQKRLFKIIESIANVGKYSIELCLNDSSDVFVFYKMPVNRLNQEWQYIPFDKDLHQDEVSGEEGGVSYVNISVSDSGVKLGSKVVSVDDFISFIKDKRKENDKVSVGISMIEGEDDAVPLIQIMYLIKLQGCRVVLIKGNTNN